MSKFLDELRQGMQEAQKRFAASQQRLASLQAEFQAAQQKLTAAQMEFNVAAQELQAFQTLVNSQSRKEQQNGAAPSNSAPNLPAQLAPPATTTPPAPNLATAVRLSNVRIVPPPNNPAIRSTVTNTSQPSPSSPQITPSQPSVEEDHGSDQSMTQSVRMLLRDRPAGMTPAEIWDQLHSQLSNRVYLYSILKRLKDRGHIRGRRGKYYFVPQQQETPPAVVVQ